MRYEIEAGRNSVRVFEDDKDVPFLYQPNWPDGTAWSSPEEAEIWAQAFIASYDDAVTVYAPNGPGQEGHPKMTPEEIAVIHSLTQ